MLLAGAGNAPFQLADGLDAWRTGLFAFYFFKIGIADTARLMERPLRECHTLQVLSSRVRLG